MLFSTMINVVIAIILKFFYLFKYKAANDLFLMIIEPLYLNY